MLGILSSIWEFFQTDAGGVGILLTILTALWAALRAFAKRRAELRVERLKIFHQLIKWLVAPDETGQTWQDCQVGVIYELRNLPEYFEPSKKILQGLLEDWGKDTTVKKRLIEEIRSTITEIERKSKTIRYYVKRGFRNYFTY